MKLAAIVAFPLMWIVFVTIDYIVDGSLRESIKQVSIALGVIGALCVGSVLLGNWIIAGDIE